MKPNRRVRTILLVALVSLPFVLAIARQLSRPKVFLASGLVAFYSVDESVSLDLFKMQFCEISNLLSSSQTVTRLAAVSEVNTSDFKLKFIKPVRGIRFLELRYSGASSNGTQRVASNACEVMLGFYRTNLPSAAVSNLGARIHEPRRFWEYPLWRLKEEWEHPERFSAD